MGKAISTWGFEHYWQIPCVSLITNTEGCSRKTDAVTGPRSALESWSAMSKTRSFALGTAKEKKMVEKTSGLPASFVSKDHERGSLFSAVLRWWWGDCKASKTGPLCRQFEDTSNQQLLILRLEKRIWGQLFLLPLKSVLYQRQIKSKYYRCAISFIVIITKEINDKYQVSYFNTTYFCPLFWFGFALYGDRL